MAFYCATMLSIALELARDNPATEDMASKFFEHFVAIADAMNTQGGTGLWDKEDGFYYDQLRVGANTIPLKVRSLVGLIPLLAVEVLDDELIQGMRGFKKRMDWFLENRPELNDLISYCCLLDKGKGRCHRLLAIPTRAQLERVLRYVLDENEFLSPLRHPLPVPRPQGPALRLPPQRRGTSRGLRARRIRHPVLRRQLQLARPRLAPAQLPAHRGLGTLPSLLRRRPAGGMPDRFRQYGCNLQQVAAELRARLARLFLRDAQGRRPCHGADHRFAEDPHWRDLLLFHEYFHGETGRGLGASHQTGWTALVTRLLEAPAR